MNIFRNLCLLIGASCLMTQMAFAGTASVDLTAANAALNGALTDGTTGTATIADYQEFLNATLGQDNGFTVAGTTTIAAELTTAEDGTTTLQYKLVNGAGTETETSVNFGNAIDVANITVNAADEITVVNDAGDITESAAFTLSNIDADTATQLGEFQTAARDYTTEATRDDNIAAANADLAASITADNTAAATAIAGLTESLTIDANTIESANIVNGTITADDLADGSVTMAKLSTGVQQEFTNLKAGIAMQAAMTMASQGINGKKFTVNAGIGNYDSQSAIAVGLRYVLNEKTQFSFATSTPLSSDADGLLSTAAGVSFGF